MIQDDLCWKLDGFYLDVMSNYLGTWSCKFDHTTIAAGFKTRDEAEEWLKSKSLKELVGLLKENK